MEYNWSVVHDNSTTISESMYSIVPYYEYIDHDAECDTPPVDKFKKWGYNILEQIKGSCYNEDRTNYLLTQIRNLQGYDFQYVSNNSISSLIPYKNLVIYSEDFRFNYALDNNEDIDKQISKWIKSFNKDAIDPSKTRHKIVDKNGYLKYEIASYICDNWIIDYIVYSYKYSRYDDGTGTIFNIFNKETDEFILLGDDGHPFIASSQFEVTVSDGDGQGLGCENFTTEWNKVYEYICKFYKTWAERFVESDNESSESEE